MDITATHEVIDIARANNVTIIVLPPHCTHKLQPLDKTFMGVLKTYYSEEIRVWLHHSNRPLTAYDVTELFGKAYLKSRRMPLRVLKSQIFFYPLKKNIFSGADFIADEIEAEKNSSCQLEHDPQVQEQLPNDETNSDSNTSEILTVCDPRIIVKNTSLHQTSVKKSNHSGFKILYFYWI
ncbi:hypothetical protein NQ314_017629 [Rhamnusium bicolor]|uniref:DDE-1 domain-containing protein n=1 Tax=Rhamnusium bicolor TaxID=1586634 RepID=A0AAV8WVC2_9CUCU|nr:hypothetical protein NQ314_017629 [Rhamnusium bicolor]